MSMKIALSGMNAANKDLAVTSNNIANSNTVGFKSSRAEFADVYGAGSGGQQVGAGVRLSAVARQFTQGDLQYTDRELDFAISGGGFFTLQGPTGPVYSRAGNFTKNPQGFVENRAGQRLQVFLPSLTGTGFDTGRMADLRINTDVSPPNATANTKVYSTLPAGASAPVTAPFNPADSTSYNHTTSMEIFDSLGATHTQTLYYVKTANPNEWQVYAQVDNAPAAAVGLMQYSASGALTAPAGGTFTIPPFAPTNGAAPMNLTVDVRDSVQYGKSFSVNKQDRDGNETGEYAGIEVSEDGVVTARYNNGEFKELGQLAMTRFENEQGLKSLGDNGYQSTTESGLPTLGAASSSGFGQIQAGALESSNVNLTEQLINMITAQRSVQANSQVISANDQALQSAINISR